MRDAIPDESELNPARTDRINNGKCWRVECEERRADGGAVFCPTHIASCCEADECLAPKQSGYRFCLRHMPDSEAARDAEIASLRSALKTAQEEAARAWAAVEEQKKDPREVAKDLWRRIDTLSAENAALRLEVQRLTEHADLCARRDNETFRAFGGNYLWCGQTIAEAVRALASERDSLKARLSELEEAEASRQDEVAALKAQVAALVKEANQRAEDEADARATSPRPFPQESDATHRLKLIAEFVAILTRESEERR